MICTWYVLVKAGVIGWYGERGAIYLSLREGHWGLFGKGSVSSAKFIFYLFWSKCDWLATV